jgi:hypothetical protein
MHQEDDYNMKIKVMLKSLVIQMLTEPVHRQIRDLHLDIVFLLEDI